MSFYVFYGLNPFVFYDSYLFLCVILIDFISFLMFLCVILTVQHFGKLYCFLKCAISIKWIGLENVTTVQTMRVSRAELHKNVKYYTIGS